MRGARGAVAGGRHDGEAVLVEGPPEERGHRRHRVAGAQADVDDPDGVLARVDQAEQVVERRLDGAGRRPAGGGVDRVDRQDPRVVGHARRADAVARLRAHDTADVRAVGGDALPSVLGVDIGQDVPLERAPGDRVVGVREVEVADQVGVVEVAPRVDDRHGHAPSGARAVGVLHVAPRPGDRRVREVPLLVQLAVDRVARRHLDLGALGDVLRRAHVPEGEVDDPAILREQRRRLPGAHALGDGHAREDEPAEPVPRGDRLDVPQDAQIAGVPSGDRRQRAPSRPVNRFRASRKVPASPVEGPGELF